MQGVYFGHVDKISTIEKTKLDFPHPLFPVSAAHARRLPSIHLIFQRSMEGTRCSHPHQHLLPTPKFPAFPSAWGTRNSVIRHCRITHLHSGLCVTRPMKMHHFTLASFYSPLYIYNNS